MPLAVCSLIMGVSAVAAFRYSASEPVARKVRDAVEFLGWMSGAVPALLVTAVVVLSLQGTPATNATLPLNAILAGAYMGFLVRYGVIRRYGFGRQGGA